ncbi:hypothetical protein KIW84_015104 [Lathyrus oleraceus]|uniref:RRM domain-containing protein n=1 Tax=Pisum sativum TaxID=3888 RepID=A0A9D5BPQ9_PEA|nr:hypothetical protein KIW84_015104 [Pisum sativum]
MRAKDLYKLFEEFGVIDEVIIPRKRDKKGRKYWFIHIFDVSDMRRLMLQLDNLLIEGRKLFANIPRGSSYVDITRVPGYRKACVDPLSKSDQQVILDVGNEELKRFERAFVGKDMANFMVRTSCGMLINEMFKVNINGVPFRVRVVEENLGPSTSLVKKFVSSAPVSDS